MKEKLNSKLNDAMTKFPEKESFRIFKEKMTNMIVEEKTESTTPFNFPINETGLEGFDLTPIMGQKTNDQTENEDKEGNGEEDSDNDASQPEVDYLLDSNEADNEGIKNDADKNKKKVKLDQEDEIWNHPEMKTIFDNIDIGSPMSIGKTNTLAEKEKSEGVHEQGTKFEKTKGDDTGGREANNKKGGGEEKQIEIEKGNTEDRGKKKSENQNKKGEKADKTKGNKEDTHPSFSLGLNQDSDQTSSKNSNESSPKKALTKKQIKDDHQKVVIRLAKKIFLNPNPISVSIPTVVGPSKHDLVNQERRSLLMLSNHLSNA
ncbi:unnamed protein product [Lactuca saligna]|uniref:Uncharacterized protein n=1 Tax=Lactuca saligna TaxID=75948 RepID=A0AA35YVJ7_LACSI|nr:unnamed protein product [Lactuca saligna]